MIIVTVLLHMLLNICTIQATPSNICINQAMSNNVRAPNIGDFVTELTMFCHSALHYGDFTNTTLRTFDMKEFIKGNPKFPPFNTVLTDLVSRIEKRVKEQTGEVSSTKIQFDCLDILKDKKFYAEDLNRRFPQLKRYFGNRQKVSDTLCAITTVAKSIDMPSWTHYNDMCQEVGANTVKVKNEFLSIPNLAAAADFDLALMNLLILTMIGDFYRYQIVGGLCYKNKAELADSRNDWAQIEVAYQRQENYLLENWAKEKLADDIKITVEQSIAPDNTDPFPRPHISIQKFLENKYYWNAFRVHIYPKQKVADVERFLCTSADTYPKTACVKGGDMIVVVHWQPLAEEKLTGANNEVLDRRTPSPQQKPVFDEKQDKPAPSSTFTAARAGLDMASTLEPAAQATLDTFYSKETVIKGKAIVQQSAKQARGAAKVFKGVLKFAVNVGKFLGPLAMGVTGLLGVFLDEGAPNVMEEMREGFKDMSNEFRKLDIKLDEVKNEIVDAVKSETWMASFHVSYFEHVKLPLKDLRGEFGKYDIAIAGPSEEGKRIQLLAICDQYRYAEIKSPVGLLNHMHTYFATTPTKGKNFPDAIKNWQEAKSHRPTLQLLLAGFLMDVTDLEVMVQRCLPILINGATNEQQKKQVAAVYIEEVARAHQKANEINRVIFQLNHDQLYGWIELIRDTFNKWSPSSGSDLTSMSASLAQELQRVYDWNAFNVLAFKNKVEGYGGSASEAYVLHPDYTKILTRNEYTYVINWANADEQVTKMENFAGKFADSGCEHVNTASMLMDRVSNNGVPKGTKSVYIRKDIVEEGLYGPNGEKGSTIVDEWTKKALHFKEPRACCGTGGELAVSYGPNMCTVDRNERNEYSYCIKTERKGGRTATSRKLCTQWQPAKRLEKHKYTITMNTGGGY